jgi:hypothetical protein
VPSTRRTASRPLIGVLALNGVRVCEATGADIEALGLARAPHLTSQRKGGLTSEATGA